MLHFKFRNGDTFLILFLLYPIGKNNNRDLNIMYKHWDYRDKLTLSISYLNLILIVNFKIPDMIFTRTSTILLI